jgi:serine/threonine protein phosphatase PrpC
LSRDVEFMIVACDGLWDKVSYSEAVDLVAAGKNSGKPAKETVELLVKHSLDRGTMDNVTTIVVYFHHQ